MDERDRRIGLNEALFRQVNEAVEGLSSRLDVEDFAIVCECGDLGCTDKIHLTPAAYRALRDDASHFAVVPGHEVPDVERVIEENEGYFVVEKSAPEARELAERTDPT
jgi:hypothetical protein